MTEGNFFKKNILSLSKTNPELSARLAGLGQANCPYKILESRSGETVPAWIDSSGTAHPLHSMIDPRKEAKRLISTVENAGFLVLLGLGGAFHAEAALERDDIALVLAIEFDLEAFAAMLCLKDYSPLLGNSRFHLMVDNNESEIVKAILDLYRPILFGGIRAMPLRTRTVFQRQAFARAANAVEAAIDRLSTDYSVQAHFGKRWFSNILRNLALAEEIQDGLPEARRAAICAAGPSLSLQIPLLKKRRKSLFIISADTSLPSLLHQEIIPDAVISIDCQHISYLHFMKGLPKECSLFLDLASPPLLALLSKRKQFFAGTHPLTRYASRAWKELPVLDTSGGNVTHAALSLAEALGAEEIEIYGADFSYPLGSSYARGSYIYSLFESRQSRLYPIEAQSSAFLFRTSLEKISRVNSEVSETCNSWYYETKLLKLYRERLEEKIKSMKAKVIQIEGAGAPINVTRHEKASEAGNKGQAFPGRKAKMNAKEFLESYKNKIICLPKPENSAAEYLASLKDEASDVFTTMLPAAAALKRRSNEMSFQELIEATRNFCLREIDINLAQ